MLALDRWPATYACHCLNCQTMSGGPCGIQAPLPIASFALEGPLAAWTRPYAQGGQGRQYFCATCRTRLYSDASTWPGAILLRAGTLDDSGELIPDVHMWTRRRQRWVAIPIDAETYDEGMPPPRMAALFAANGG